MSQPYEEEKQSFWGSLAGSVPFIGPVLSGLIERGQNRRAIERQNEYNKPINQLARLREAGLPYAAMTNSISGNQSQAQPGNSTGIAEGINSYVHTTLQRKQLELLKEQIESENVNQDKTRADTGKTQIETERERIARDLEMDRVYNYDLSKGDGLTLPTDGSNQVANLIREQQLKKVDTYLKDNQGKAIDLEMDIKKAKTPYEIQEIRTRIANMMQEMGIRAEDLKIRQADLKMRQGKYPWEIKESQARIGQMRLEAGMYPLRYHQGRLNAEMSQQHVNAGSVIDSLIRSMKEDGMSLGEAFFHSIFTGGVKGNPFNLNPYMIGQ